MDRCFEEDGVESERLKKAPRELGELFCFKGILKEYESFLLHVLSRYL